MKTKGFAILPESEYADVITPLLEETLVPRYIVKVDENEHFMDQDSRWTLGVFDTPEEAIAAAKHLVDVSLREHLVPGITPEKLFNAYRDCGDDPHIGTDICGVAGPIFSAWDYAKARAVEMCAAYR
jgi:hypothetical protein